MIKDLFGILVIVSVNVIKWIDYEYCKCRKILVDKLVDECTETLEEVKLAKITLAKNENNYKCSSCTEYILLIIVFFTVLMELLFILFIKIGLWLKIMFPALNLVFPKKQRFCKHINGKNQTN